jgi:Predicted ATP-dependent serine protease
MGACGQESFRGGERSGCLCHDQTAACGKLTIPRPSLCPQRASETPGSAILVTRKGTRPLLVENQALTDDSSLSNPRRVTLGLDQNRLAMLVAVLQRHCGRTLGDQDLFVNAVGGVRLSETGADLAVATALVSSQLGRPVPAEMVLFGEVGLAGEVRPVQNGPERLAEAAKHGFTRAVVPHENAPKKGIPGLSITRVKRLEEALDAVFER